MAFAGVGSPVLWLGFLVFVLLVLALDLGVFHRHVHVVGRREALAWSAVWVALSLVFGAGMWWKFGSDHALEFLTGYVLEKSLSVDNVFVFILIFTTLKIPVLYQHRVLFWGILAALLLRGVMILGGAALLERFHWLIYFFGGFLVITGARIALQHGKEEHPGEHRLMRFVKRHVPATDVLEGPHFFVRKEGRRLATPLFVALILVEFSDVVFAVDSIPAVFAVTEDPFIVFTSNIFALLGLRSLFFLLTGMVEEFAYLKFGLAAVLVFVGTKMALSGLVHIHPALSLLVVIGLLGASVAASVAKRRAHEAATKSTG